MASSISGIENIKYEDAIEVIRIIRSEARTKGIEVHLKIIKDDANFLIIRWHPTMVEEFCFYKTRIFAGCDRVFNIFDPMGPINYDLIYKAYNYLKEKGYKIPV